MTTALENLDAQLKQAKTTVCLTPQAIRLNNVGDKFRGMFVSVTTFPKTDPNTGEVHDQPVANFFAQGNVWYNMGKQLLDVMSKVPFGTSVEIELAQLKANKNSQGETKIYKISPLNIPIVNVNEAFGGTLQISAPPAEDMLHPAAPSAPVEVIEHAPATDNGVEQDVATNAPATNPDGPATEAQKLYWAKIWQQAKREKVTLKSISPNITFAQLATRIVEAKNALDF